MGTRKLILKRWCLLVGILLCLTPQLKSQEINYQIDWVGYFSNLSEFELVVHESMGFLRKTGNVYHTLILTQEVYADDAVWHYLDINLPMKGAFNKRFAFRGEEALEPLEFDVKEISITVLPNGNKIIRVRDDIPTNHNPTNTDLGSYFNNARLHASKSDREDKLKEKKAKKWAISKVSIISTWACF